RLLLHTLSHPPTGHARALEELCGSLDRPLLDAARREAHGVRNSVRPGAAVSHHRDAPEPEEDRPTRGVRVHLAAKPAERRAKEEPPEGGARSRAGGGP